MKQVCATCHTPDYTQWHGMFEVAERFYMKLIPEARAADAVIDEITREMQRRYGPAR